MRDLTISVGRSRNDTDWMPKKVSWEDICQQLSHCKRTGETVAEYKAMTKEDKAKAKDVGGFVGGSVTGRRVVGAVVSRSVISLDLDYAKAADIDSIREAVDGTAWCLYSTHSHTPEAPRLRLVLPLDRDVTPEEFDPIARRIADYVGIESVDPASFRINQLMYWPSAPKDGEFIHEVGKGAPVNADAMLATYRNWKDFTDYPRTPGETEIRETKGRMEDPTAKPGYIGAFCKLYPISEAIDKFLPDVYEPAGEGRYTYKGGTTAGGMIVFDDLFAYSYHATDPAAGRELNAFDLVRIHKFGGMDTEADDDTKITSMPSFKAMEDFCESIPEVKVLHINRAVRQTAEEAFSGEIPEDSEMWKTQLRLNKKNIIVDPYNCDIILNNDPALKGTVKYDEFADRAEIQRDLPWRKVKKGECWDDTDDKGLLWYMSKEYNMTGKQTILDAHDLTIMQSSYHPVRDYLNSLVWDGTARLDTMLVDYLNADDTPLVRAMTRKHMVAAVARIMVPGTKYDYALTLSGPEGIGKTTLIKRLGMKWYSNSFSSGDVGDKTSMEQVRSQWLIELGELVSIRKNTNEAFKNFLTTNVDKFRPAYARKSIEVPRQCVFWATTNERYYLKGDTGNRRFWTVYVHSWDDDLPVCDVFSMKQDEVDQLWAEAVYRYKQGEELFLDHSLEAQARALAEEANEISGDERIGEIAAFIRRPIPTDWYKKTRSERADWFRLHRDNEDAPEGPEHRRNYICSREIANELYQKDMTRYEMKEINQLLIRIPGLKQLGPTNTADKAYGCQRRYEIKESFWHDTKESVAEDELE